MKIEKTPDTGVITRTPFPKSTKIYVKGQLHDISVAMREIALTDTKVHGKAGLVEHAQPGLALLHIVLLGAGGRCGEQASE